MRSAAEQGPGIVVLARGARPGLLRVIGEVDASNADYFASVLLSESRRVPILTLDAERLRFLSGEGFRAIVRTAGELHRRGGALHLAGPNRLIRRMADVLRAARSPGLVILDEVPSEEADPRTQAASRDAG
jgi:anti-anti-sigma factor